MRNELKNIEKIELYITNQLSEKDRLDFEQELAKSPVLVEQVASHKLLLQAIRRKHLRSEIVALGSGASFAKWKLWGLGGAFLIVVLFAFLFKKNKSYEVVKVNNDQIELVENKKQTLSLVKTDSAETVEVLVEKDSLGNKQEQKRKETGYKSKPIAYKEDTECGGLKTFVAPDIQHFEVDAKKGKTIEGKQGTLVIIPSDAFLDSMNQKVVGAVDFELVEALTLEDMVLYNLTTTSNGKLLETGGMFYMNATQNGMPLKINPNRPIYTETPTETKKKGMLAFDSEIDSAGNINWTNPKPLVNYLTKIDLDLLDFLPNGFANGVEGALPYKNYKKSTPELVDSLYYSLGESTGIQEMPTSNYIPKRKFGVSWRDKFIGLRMKKKIKEDTNVSSLINKTENSMKLCGINPLSIKTIKTSKFEQTYLATKEMEERIGQLHQLNNGDSLLQIYIENLGHNLFVADSIVMEALSGKGKEIFNAFYQQKLTDLKNVDNIYQNQLSNYYNKKKKQYAKDLNRLKGKLAQKSQEELEALQRKISQNTKEYLKASQPKKSPKQILKSSLGSMGQSIPRSSVVATNSYPARWSSFGWKNIDAYLHLLSKGAETVIITSSKKAEFNRVFQYLNTIKTLTPLLITENTSLAKFPKRGSKEAKQMQSTYCFNIAKEDGKYYWVKQNFNPYQQSNLTLTATEMPLQKIREALRIAGKEGSEALNFFEKNIKATIKYKKEQAKRMKQAKIDVEKRAELLRIYKVKQAKLKLEIERKKQLRMAEKRFITKLRNIAFPCENEEVVDIVVQKTTKVKFPGGPKALLLYLKNNTNYPKEAEKQNISGKIYVQVTINEVGEIINPIILKSIHPLLDKEALRVIREMPNWIPAKAKGVNISVVKTIPIGFHIN